MQGDRRVCRPSSRSVTRMAGTEGTEATGLDGYSNSGASTPDAEGQTWHKDAEEADHHGPELPGNLASPWSPPSVRSILCAPAEPLLLAAGNNVSSRFLHPMKILLLPGS